MSYFSSSYSVISREIRNLGIKIGFSEISKFRGYSLCCFHVLCEKAFFRNFLMVMVFDGFLQRWVTYR
ncbi:hypothetical protein T11_12731 [Trichinella zimbabwensis]|uniref:Uncharacterized protein n=1 Tax=Trichinella zimbabwensis TaxID=268475 RepID=A0A0V1GQF7_9BILA|nr:hypothetical protein T11_12731 [Trichinella zimbabwensis]